MAVSHDAFISYSHRADGRLAPAIESGLEKLAKPILKLRALEVFRDETSLAANPELWGGIVNHLTGSKWFLLMASPESAASHWCNKEILWWLENRGLDRMLILLTGGEIAWDGAAGDFDWSRTTALSRSLSGKLKDEPLYVDLRWAREQEKLTLADSKFRGAVLDLAAPIRGVPKDQLDGDDVRQLKRNKRIVRGLQGGVAIAGIVAAGLAVVAWLQRDEALHQRDMAAQAATRAEVQRAEAVFAGADAENQAKIAQAEQAEAEHQRDEADRQRKLAEERERIARSRQLAAESLSALERQERTSALRLAAEAGRAQPTKEARVALLRAAQEVADAEWLMRGHSQPLHTVAMSPDGRRAVTGGRDGAAVLWDLAARQPIGTLAHDRGNFVNLAAFSPDMQRLVTATRGRVWFWNPVTGAGDGEPISALSDYEDLTDLAFADAGRALVAAGSDGSVVLWDVRSRTRLGPALSGRRESVGAVAVEPGGTRIAIGLRNGRVLLWDYASAARPLEFPDGHGDRVEAVAFAPDGKRVATGGSDGRVVLWDAVTLKRLGAEKAAGGAVHTLVFSPDGRRLAAAGADGKLTLWDSDAGFRGGVWLPAHSRPVRKLAFSPDGRRVITASDDTTAVLWEVVERDKFSRIVRRYEGSVRRLSFVHGGRFLAVGRLRALNIVDLATGAPVTEIKGENGGEIDTAALSADGRRAALVDEGQVSLWESPGRRDRVPAPAGGKPARLALSPDGRRLAIGRDDGGISVWDWEARRFLSQAAGAHKRITALAFSPDASRLASGGIEGAINLWTVGAAEQKPRRVGSARGAVADLAFSPDGTRLAAGGDEEEIVVWDLRAAEPVATRITDYAGITRSMLGITRAIAFSPDGRMVVSAGTGQAIAIWDADTGRPIGRPFEGHEKPILAMAFSPDGKLLASGGQDATLRIWNLDIAWWVHRACRLIDPGISPDDWQKRVPGAPYPESCRSDKSSPEGRALPAQALIPASRSTSAAASRR